MTLKKPDTSCLLRYLLLTLAFCAATTHAMAHDAKGPSSIAELPLEHVSERIHLVYGTQQLPSPATRGFMNNPAAIVGDTGIIIVDPGSSAEIGRELLDKVRKISDLPVVAVFNTHVHGDHWLGNHGVRTRWPKVPIYAHERMITRIEAGEGENWVALLSDMTQGAVDGTQVVAPNIGLKGGETLRLAGVTLKIHHTGHAHTDHDLMIELVDDRALFFGDIVAARRVPSSDVPRDASYRGQARAIRSVIDGGFRLFIPGHGRGGGLAIPLASLRFLEALDAAVSRYYREGLADFEMKGKVAADLAEFRQWHNFNELGRVISFMYQEVERDDFR